MKQIIVYVDLGVDGASLKHTVKSLQREIDPAHYRIRRMDSKTLKSEGWEQETALLVVPGGRDVFYHEALDGQGTSKIRKFVEEGGSYLGICAGAYFGAEAIEFEKGGNSEVCAQRSLAFFPGLAEGPAYGKNKYRVDGLQGIEAARVSWKGDHFHVYYNGGCQFIGAHEVPGVSVLSSYLELEGDPAAIISAEVGKGKVILSGVHFEYSVLALQRNNPYIEKIYTLLEKGENQRSQVFRETLSYLLQK
ncbi:MAG TPA: BPL-N domain-containing protein [Rhabdochlamydiaceae bacterium]|jgi:biotin--protein ligase|nr:BPL-N domain-containing protein [Rhabdochlamydiaceae bacterium]